MAPEAPRTSNASSPDWTQGPAKWGSAGFLGGAALVGLVWVLGSREPSPMLDRSAASMTISARQVEPADVRPAPVIEPEPDAAADTPIASEAIALLEPAPEPPVGLLHADEEPSPAPVDAQEAPEPEPLPESSLIDLEPSPAPVSEESDKAAPEPRGDPALAIRIRVNSAGPSELELLPGIGPVIAKRIADDRATNGAFRDLRALQRVKGIGPKTAEKLAPHIRFD